MGGLLALLFGLLFAGAFLWDRFTKGKDEAARGDPDNIGGGCLWMGSLAGLGLGLTWLLARVVNWFGDDIPSAVGLFVPILALWVAYKVANWLAPARTGNHE